MLWEDDVKVVCVLFMGSFMSCCVSTSRYVRKKESAC